MFFVVCFLFCCCFFLKYNDLHVLPRVLQPMWGVGEIVPFILFFVGWGQGGALKFYNPGIVCGYIVHLLWLHVLTFNS